MKQQDIKTYDDLENYLKTFHSFGGDATIYDFNGIVHLLLALLDNLRKNALEAELEDMGDSMTKKQKDFWIKLCELIAQ